MILNHCVSCDHELKRSVKRAHTKYQCFVCNKFVPSVTRSCKNHPDAKTSAILIPEKVIMYKCRNCGLPANGKFNNNRLKKAVDSLQRSVIFDRSFMKILSNSPLGHNSVKVMKAIVKHIDKYNPKKTISALKDAWLSEQQLSDIVDNTECDKWVEKTRLENVLLWSMSLFMSKKLASLPITAIADASNSDLGRKLTGEKAVDHNTIGMRLENRSFILGLEKILQLCTAQLGSKVFNEEKNLIPVYYDWSYFSKSGNIWKKCKKIGRGDTNKGIKMGIGMDWESKSVVALVMHGEEHPNDAQSFKKHLMLSDRPGIVHITDKGPFSSDIMMKIRNNKQHFIIPLKNNIKYEVSYDIFKGVEEFTLSTASKTKIQVLAESIIELDNCRKLGEIKYIKFKYNSPRTGQFETSELLSTLPLSAPKIIEMSAWRWRATETEFRTFQHEFGLETLYLKKPEKTWPILLLVLSSKMLLELTFRGIHMLHGGIMMLSSFKRGFAKFLSAIFNGEEPWQLIEPCNSPVCPYRRKHGQRLR